MKGALVALSLLLVLARAEDECLAFSWAPSQVDQLAATDNLETGFDFANALSQLWAVYSSSSNPARLELYYGLANGNFYSVSNCYSEVYADSPICYGGTQYILQVRNRKAFGDTVIHAFRTDGNGNLVGSSPYYKSADNYDPRQRPWYKQGSGWTDPYVYTAGTTGVTYYHSFTGGVAAGDRIGSEPCGPCLDGSFPIPWSQSWAASQRLGANLQTLFGIQEYAQKMIANVKSFSQEIFKEVFIGFSNGNYYSIGDCRNPVEGCKHDGYVLRTRNEYVFNNDSLVSFQLDEAGKISSKATYGSSYDPRTRPWYVQGDGWTSSYISATTNSKVKAFSQQLNGGVTAATIPLDSRGNCYQGRNGEYVEGESPFPTGPVYDDDCLSVSWAPLDVDRVAALPNLEKGTNFANALSQLWAVYSLSTNPNGVELYYGLDSGNWYALANCKSAVLAGGANCNGKSQFVFIVRNKQKFGDTVLHTYNTDDNGKLVGEPFYKGKTPYNPTVRPWYQQGSGWTGSYVYAQTGYVGRTYYHSFSGGVAGGDRFGGEPCSACLSGSFPVPWALSWAAIQSGGASLVSVDEVEDYAQKMIANVRAFTSEVFLSTYIGFSNGYYYGISDCRNVNIDCKNAGFLLSARNDVVFGNDSLVQYQLDLQGRIISEETYLDAYDPRVRPFYTQGTGWGDAMAVGDIMVRSYSNQLNGGVAAASVPVTTKGRCYLGRAGQVARSSLPVVDASAAPSLLSSPLSLVLSLFAAFVWAM